MSSRLSTMEDELATTELIMFEYSCYGATIGLLTAVTFFRFRAIRSSIFFGVGVG